MPRVRIPELHVGPPLTRWKRERVVTVSPKEAEILVAEQNAVILPDEPSKAKPEPKAKA
jgi:hypothetical protein